MATNKDPLFVDPVLLQQAEQLCKQRLQNDPDNRAVLRSLAEVYRKLGNLEAAAAAYNRLFRLDPQDQEAGYLQAVFGGKEWPIAPTGLRAAPFVLLKDFLPREFHDSIIPFLVSARRDKFVPARVLTGEYIPDIRETLNFMDKWEGKQRFKDHFKEMLPRLIPRLHVPPFEIDRVEVYVRAYQDGHFYKVHMDAPATYPDVANRTVSFVYFFHRIPRPYTGGDLLLFDSNIEALKMTRARFTRVVPEDNSIIIFPSKFFHCVVPVRCPSKEFADSRFVINGFVQKREEAELAVAGTIADLGGVAGAGSHLED